MPGGVVALWLQNFVWFSALGLVPLLLFLLVPDGSLPSPRRRPVAWLTVADMVVVIVAVAFSPGPIGGDPLPGAPQNPVGIEPAGQVLELAGLVGFFMAPALAVVAPR